MNDHIDRTTLLAAVRSAASDTQLTAAPAGNEPKETETMSTALPAAPATITSVAALTAAYPELCATMRTEAATAERERIAGIDKLARPGREKLISDAKADPTMTAERAALTILAADDAARAVQLAGVKAVEDEGAKVPAAPRAGGDPPATKLSGTTPDEWKAEYAATPALRDEYASADDYAAYRKAMAEGKVKILRRPSAA